MTSKDVLVKMWQVNGSIPGRKDAARDPSVDADKFAKVAVAELANSRPVPLIPQWPQIVDATLERPTIGAT